MATSPVPSDARLAALAGEVASACLAAGFSVTAAESCTGGYIAKVLTDLPGSSQWFGTGFVTYSNEAKTALLGVPKELLDAEGAVSEAVVRAMAEGAWRRSGARRAVAVSGIAGRWQCRQTGRHRLVRLGGSGDSDPGEAASVCR